MATEEQKLAAGSASSISSANSSPVSTAGRVDRSSPVQSAVGVEAPGRTSVADGVVAKIAGIAAREVPGVFALGGGGARALGALRDVMNATDLTQGVKVEVGETQVAADITIVVEYPAPVHQVAADVRAAVTAAITGLVGLEVVEVNIDVNDVHLPGDDTTADDSRVS